ncbi:MAG TPA: hypothetical protein VF961_11115, partial [Pyrinomonadaceae bacterium]
GDTADLNLFCEWGSGANTKAASSRRSPNLRIIPGSRSTSPGPTLGQISGFKTSPICCMPSLSHTWGTTSTERQLVFPCDRIISNPDDSLFRGVTIRASSEIVFRWLCQMRVAPYSYDWIDNGGRQSPRELLPGLENLSVGQHVMRIFDLVDFKRHRHLTLRVKPGTRAERSFGDIAVSYMIVTGTNNDCRLLVKLIAKFPSGIRGRFMRAVLPWGDLVMMRRQLLNFKQLAERNIAGGQ